MININLLRYIGNLKLGTQTYYSVLMHDQHPILSIGAASRLIDQNLIFNKDFEKFVQLSQYKAVRNKLLPAILESCPEEMVLSVLRQKIDKENLSVDDLILAKIASDEVKIIECCYELFKNSGNFKWLEEALLAAPKVSSIYTAIEIAIFNILLNPENGVWALALLDLLLARGADDILRNYLNILEDVGEYEALASIIKIHLALAEKKNDIAEKELNRIFSFELPGAVQFHANKLYAKFLEAKEKYQEACEYFNKTNLWLRAESYKKGGYLEYVSHFNNLKFNPVASSPQEKNYLIMLGFPRSGTTLLENILDSHPSIRTLEELGTLAQPDTLLHKYLEEHPDKKIIPQSLVKRIKKTYYSALNVGEIKTTAKYTIDKMPIMSSRAPYLKNIFIDKRYIFSIRHPYDVVLSCFKQTLGTNLAMDCFTSFEETCETYDFIMGLWFSNFDLDSQNVCYVKYDDLCNNFDEA
jgi:tetratricopeptide (TPR) repeat protein